LFNLDDGAAIKIFNGSNITIELLKMGARQGFMFFYIYEKGSSRSVSASCTTTTT